MVFLGSDDAAAACLAALCGRDLVSAAVTPPPRRRGRGGHPEPTPVAAVATERGCDVLAAADVNAPEIVARIAARAPRLLVVVSFGQILKRAVRETAPLGCVNLHYSLLPRWRGAAPVQRAILAGDAETGACVQRLVARLDAGAVLDEERVAIGPRDDTPSLRARLTAVGAPLLVRTVERLLLGGEVHERVQDESAVTLAPPLGRAEGDLDFAAETAAEIDRRIRALEPWPRCRARIVRADGATADVVVRAAVAEPDGGSSAAAPGGVVSSGADGIRVAAAGGVVRITRLQRTGGKDLDARSFVNGFAVGAGDRFVRPPAGDGAAD